MIRDAQGSRVSVAEAAAAAGMSAREFGALAASLGFQSRLVRVDGVVMRTYTVAEVETVRAAAGAVTETAGVTPADAVIAAADWRADRESPAGGEPMKQQNAPPPSDADFIDLDDVDAGIEADIAPDHSPNVRPEPTPEPTLELRRTTPMTPITITAPAPPTLLRAPDPEPPPEIIATVWPFVGQTSAPVLCIYHPDRTTSDRLCWMIARSIAAGLPPGVTGTFGPMKTASFAPAAGSVDYLIDQALVPTEADRLNHSERYIETRQALVAALDASDAGVIVCTSGAVLAQTGSKPDVGRAALALLACDPVARIAVTPLWAGTGSNYMSQAGGPEAEGWGLLKFADVPGEGVFEVTSAHLPIAVSNYMASDPDAGLRVLGPEEVDDMRRAAGRRVLSKRADK